MAMKVTILGSGTCVPRLDRSACAVLVETGQSKILFDLGPGTIRRLLECGTTIFDLTHIFFSHFHPDHTAELVPLIFSTKYPDGRQRKKLLTIIGGNGLKRFYEALQTAYGDWIVLPGEQLAVRELNTLTGQSLETGDFKVIARPVDHRPESLAYRVEDVDGTSVVYSGDTDVCDGLTDLARGADLFVCESALPDEFKSPGHLTPSLAGEIAARARVQKLVLTHLYPPCDKVDIVKQAGNKYKGPVVVAEDLMAFVLGF